MLKNILSILEQVVMVKTFDDDMKITTTHVILCENSFGLDRRFYVAASEVEIKRSGIFYCEKLFHRNVDVSMFSCHSLNSVSFRLLKY